MIEKKELASVLNDLIDICKNAEKGFQEAAEDTASAQISFYLKEYGNQRGRFATVLQGQVRALGFTPDRKGTLAGAMHRNWINIRSAINEKDETILSECQRGDERALKHYEQALLCDLPEDIRPIVEYQYSEIKEIHERLMYRGFHANCSCS
jgi:uncharacterized protein (TIGR02284 family)